MRPFRRERLTREVIDGAILLAVDLSMRPEIPSGPEDLDVSKDDNKRFLQWYKGMVIVTLMVIQAPLLPLLSL